MRNKSKQLAKHASNIRPKSNGKIVKVVIVLLLSMCLLIVRLFLLISKVKDIMSDVEDSIEKSMSTLPVDIRSCQDYTAHLNFSIYGAENLVNSHLEYDGDDYKDYLETHGASENPTTEIDFIFNRN